MVVRECVECHKKLYKKIGYQCKDCGKYFCRVCADLYNNRCECIPFNIRKISVKEKWIMLLPKFKKQPGEINMRIYRGKRIDNNEWVYGFYLKMNTHHYIYSIGCHREKSIIQEYKVYSKTVGQQIGKRDNDLIEIYEGDIIEHWYEETFFEGVIKGTVLWDDTACCFMVQYDSVSIPISNLDLDSADTFCIIGNIY